MYFDLTNLCFKSAQATYKDSAIFNHGKIQAFERALNQAEGKGFLLCLNVLGLYFLLTSLWKNMMGKLFSQKEDVTICVKNRELKGKI